MDLDYQSAFKKVIEDMKTSGDIYAEAKSQSWYQQEMKGAIVSSLMKKYPDLSATRAEAEAKSSEDYLAYLKETAKAIEAEGKAKSIYEKDKARFEGLRSLCSLEKKTRSLIGEE